MTFVVMGLGTVFNALTNRRDPASGLAPPLLKALAISLFPIAMIALATELPGLQKGLHTVSLSGTQWLACLGLAALLPLVIETGKWIRRRRAAAPVVLDPQRALAPGQGTRERGGLTPKVIRQPPRCLPPPAGRHERAKYDSPSWWAFRPTRSSTRPEECETASRCSPTERSAPRPSTIYDERLRPGACRVGLLEQGRCRSPCRC